MYKQQQTGAFSQRQFKSLKARSTNTPLDDISGSENSGLCRVSVDYDRTMGQVTYESQINGYVNVKKGDAIKLTATPNSGYKFVEWQCDDCKIANKTASTIDLVVNSDMTLAAVFATDGTGENPPAYGGSGTNENKVVSAMKKYWWVIAIILGYLILKEGKE